MSRKKRKTEFSIQAVNDIAHGLAKAKCPSTPEAVYTYIKTNESEILSLLSKLEYWYPEN